MTQRIVAALSIATLAALAGCSATRQAMEGHGNAVARVNGYVLTVDRAAELLAVAPPRAAAIDPFVVDRAVELWVNYTILASELVSPDSLENVDPTPLIRAAADQELAWIMLEELERAAEPSDEELRERYESEQPYTGLQIQHVLVRVPPAASEQALDSLERLAQTIQDRATSGERLAELVRTYSRIPASPVVGGDSGWVMRRQLAPELDQVILDLEPGQISRVLKSSVGFHILRLIQRVEPDFETSKDRYRAELRADRREDTERMLRDSLQRAADAEIVSGAVELVQRSALSPRLGRLGSAERAAVLVDYDGGALTYGEFADQMARAEPPVKRGLAHGDSAAVAGWLMMMAEDELMADAARRRGHTLPPTVADSIQRAARQEIYAAAAMNGLERRTLAGDAESIPAAVDGAVEAALRRQRPGVYVNRIAPALRQVAVVQINPFRYPEVMVRLNALRAADADTGAERSRRGAVQPRP
jgi:hypothetical protein